MIRFAPAWLAPIGSREPGCARSGKFENKRNGAGAQCEAPVSPFSPVSEVGYSRIQGIRECEYAAKLEVNNYAGTFVAPILGRIL